MHAFKRIMIRTSLSEQDPLLLLGDMFEASCVASFIHQATALTNALTWTMSSIRAIGYARRSMRTPRSIGFALNGAVVASPSTPVAA